MTDAEMNRKVNKQRTVEVFSLSQNKNWQVGINTN